MDSQHKRCLLGIESHLLGLLGDFPELVALLHHCFGKMREEELNAFPRDPRLRHVVDVGDEVLGVVLEEDPRRPAKGGHDLVVGVEDALEEVVGRDELVEEASGQNGGIRGKRSSEQGFGDADGEEESELGEEHGLGIG